MGNGRGEKPLFSGFESPSIAHHEPVASARFLTFDVPAQDFLRKRSPPLWKFAFRPERKISPP
jgi:hypothetical protein